MLPGDESRVTSLLVDATEALPGDPLDLLLGDLPVLSEPALDERSLEKVRDGVVLHELAYKPTHLLVASLIHAEARYALLPVPCPDVEVALVHPSHYSLDLRVPDCHWVLHSVS